jgi:hypothetical protein
MKMTQVATLAVEALTSLPGAARERLTSWYPEEVVTVAYALACVAAPAVWGVAMYYVFGWIQRRRARLRGRAGAPELPPIDYTI